METKTNVMRILDSRRISYRHYEYDAACAPTGADVARIMAQDPAHVFKTLVTVAKSGRNYVFVIPVCAELDLKRAATVVGEKSLDMLKQRELLGLTGYVHGGCSPIGMKKQFTTILHQSARGLQDIIFSAGRVGAQVHIAVSDLEKLIPIRFADVIVDAVHHDAVPM